MPLKAVPPRPRVGSVRRPIYRGRIDGSPAPGLRATTPTFVRSSTPAATASKPTGLKAMKCSNPTCSRPSIVESEQGLICDNCGAVAQEDSGLVSEQGFGETDSGRITALGVHVGESQTHQRTYAPGGALGNAGREPTINRDRSEAQARSIMSAYQALLAVRPAEIEAGMQIFKLAWGISFVQGRTIDSVAVVCLYLACRRKHEQIQNERRPVYSLMMIDFAERLNMDVFALGKMYQDLVRKLYAAADGGGIRSDVSADLLAHGPEVLVSRFVDALEFDKIHRDKIKMDAIRIVKRMKRDWMSTGRRPSGVCGAAILLAARMNNYRRTVREVVLTAKVTEITINKRLDEFSDTQSSKLSVSQFRDNAVLDAVAASDPPSYQRAHNSNEPIKKKRGRPKKRRHPETATEIEGDNAAGSNTSTVQPPAKRPRVDAEGFVIPDIPQRQAPVNPTTSSTLEITSSETVDAPSPSQSTVTTDSSFSLDDNATPRASGRPQGAKNWRAPPPSEAELALEKEIRRNILQTFKENEELAPEYRYLNEDDDDNDNDNDPGMSNLPPPSSEQPTSTEETSTPAGDVSGSPTVATEANAPNPSEANNSRSAITDPTATIPPHTKSGPPGPAVNTTIGNTDTVSLSPTLKPDEFDDDEDVSSCILSESESRIKERVWVSMNADWLRQDHAKRIKRELKEADMRARGLDPAKEALKHAQGKGRRKDGTKKPGRRGDVSYLNDKIKGRGGGGNEDNAGEGVEGEGEANGEGGDAAGRARSAADSVRQMFDKRGVFSTRVNYSVLESIYGIAGGDSNDNSPRGNSRSRSASAAQEGSREGSVASSVGSLPGAEGIFRGNGPRDSRRPRSKASISAERREMRRKEQLQQRERSQSVASNAPLQDRDDPPERQLAGKSTGGAADGAGREPSASSAGTPDRASEQEQQQLPTPSRAQQRPTQTSSQIPTISPSSSQSEVVKPSPYPASPSKPTRSPNLLGEEEALGSHSPETRNVHGEEEALGPIVSTSPSSEDEADGEVSLLREREPDEYEDEDSEGDEDDYINDDDENMDDADDDNEDGDEDVDAAFEGRYHSRGW